MTSPVDSLLSRLETLVSGVRIGQFLSAGLVGMAVDNAVLFGLVEFVAFTPFAAKVMSWEAAVVVIFLINENWTFRQWGDGGAGAVARRFLKSNAVRVGGFAVTMAVFLVLLQFGVWYLAANVLGIGVGFVVNYLCESVFTWRIHDDAR